MSSETSTPYTPASTSTSVAGNETVSLADEIKKYDMAKLIDFLQERDLGLSETAIKILEKKEEELEKWGMPGGPAKRLVKFAKEWHRDYTHEVPDNNKHLELCMADIKLRLQSYGTLVMTSLESMRNEYVSTILHTALRIAEDATKKKFSMRPEYEMIGDE
ncbi:16531_t:CDS:2, partial [Dentiscutata erythropus]